MLHTFPSLLFIIFHKLCHFAVERIECTWKRVQPHHHHRVSSKPWMMITFWISTWTCPIADFYLVLFIDHCWCLPYYSILSLLELFSFFFSCAVHFAWFIMRMHSIPVWFGRKKLCTVRETIDGKTGKYFAKFMGKTRALKNIEALARNYHSCECIEFGCRVNLSVYTDALKLCSQLEHEW